MDTGATALVHAGRFRDHDGAPAIGWLLGIARNLALEALRSGRAESRARRRLGVREIAISEETVERVEQMLDAGLAAERLRPELARLADQQREAIEAHVIEGRPYEELATQLRVSEATVRQRVSRGLAQLRTVFEGAGNETR